MMDLSIIPPTKREGMCAESSCRWMWWLLLEPHGGITCAVFSALKNQSDLFFAGNLGGTTENFLRPGFLGRSFLFYGKLLNLYLIRRVCFYEMDRS